MLRRELREIIRPHLHRVARVPDGRVRKALRALGLHAPVGDGIDQHLEARQLLAPVARHERDGGGEVAAGAVTPDGDTLGVNLQHAGVLQQPAVDREAVLRRGGIGMLRREAVVREDDRTADARGIFLRERIVIGRRGEDEAAAMDVHQARQHAGDAARADDQRGNPVAVRPDDEHALHLGLFIGAAGHRAQHHLRRRRHPPLQRQMQMGNGSKLLVERVFHQHSSRLLLQRQKLLDDGRSRAAALAQRFVDRSAGVAEGLELQIAHELGVVLIARLSA